MIRYEFAEPAGETARQLIALSKDWVQEDCCYGMVENAAEDLSQPLAVAVEDGKIVGYAFGHFYTQEKKSSCIETGSRCFSLDELYVSPKYRGLGIGSQLFRMLENRVQAECDYLTLATSTKNYKAILKLYIEELGMQFHSAFLFKAAATQED